VLWVDTRTLETSEPWGDQNMRAWNAELQAAVDRYPNLRVYDWASVALPEWFSSDKVHYTPDGYRHRAELIADALAAAFPG
jgi:lysophospholipase L1-like esterase